MKQPGTLVEHSGQSYLCVEGGFNTPTRTVTLLVDGENSSFPHREDDQPVTWRDQGDWFPVARWDNGELLLPDPRHREHATLAGELVERYLQSTSEPPEAAWALSEGPGKGFRGYLRSILPQGLAAELYETQELAEEAGEGAELVPVLDIPRFLTHLAREGYAGALWNGQQPLFFCLDQDDELQFLRVGEGGKSSVSMELLDPIEGWIAYDGEEQIDFLDNGEACDARLAESVGCLPMLGWPDDAQLWSPGASPSEPVVVTVEEDALDYALLFTTEEAAKEWIEEEQVKEDWSAHAVDDLDAFLSAAGEQGNGALLNPGSHRARRGVLWHDGERIVLDSFSGFWQLNEEGFALISERSTDGEDDDSGPDKD
ncbi:MAG: hypothetical protein DRQ55_08040 [Planctomycetota bacterium]|nr:MAG: hypothetical protein DRQ55_08040 [Planctomycetota bacterium]